MERLMQSCLNGVKEDIKSFVCPERMHVSGTVGERRSEATGEPQIRYDTKWCVYVHSKADRRAGLI